MEIKDLIIAVVLVIIGFVCLVKGADWFVDGAAGIAKKLRVPQLIIGLTIVSFGTSAPELATSIISAFQGSADIAVGNIIGSNITNILLILGLSAIICPLVVQKSTLQIDFPVLLGSSALLLFLGAMDGKIDSTEGWIMFAISMAYMILLIIYAVAESKKQNPAETLQVDKIEGMEKAEPKTGLAGWFEKKKENVGFLFLLTLVGLVLVVIGALYGVIPGATTLAEYFGVSEKVIGLTVVAIGTSLPELVTCVVASKKGETDIAVGDIVGSNIFNILRTLGLCSAIIPLTFEPTFLIDGLIALAAAAFLAFCGYKNKKVGRWAGFVMLIAFAAYYVYLFAI